MIQASTSGGHFIPETAHRRRITNDGQVDSSLPLNNSNKIAFHITGWHNEMHYHGGGDRIENPRI
jgi:hypothetical protein